METDQLGRLRDILEAARLIGSYVRETTETNFRADNQKQDAVIRRIEIIGEAIKFRMLLLFSYFPPASALSSVIRLFSRAKTAVNVELRKA